MSDIISLQPQIAATVADKLCSKLRGTEKQQVTQATQHPEAYQLSKLTFYKQGEVMRSSITNGHWLSVSDWQGVPGDQRQ
jgi:hypothetical protein